jgi:hypothetical protein
MLLLHARMMYVGILDQSGETLVHRNMKTDPDAFLRAIAPYRPDIVVAVECMFTWYWLADLCAEEDIPFVLGHALYMKACDSLARNLTRKSVRGMSRTVTYSTV